MGKHTYRINWLIQRSKKYMPFQFHHFIYHLPVFSLETMSIFVPEKDSAFEFPKSIPNFIWKEAGFVIFSVYEAPKLGLGSLCYEIK